MEHTRQSAFKLFLNSNIQTIIDLQCINICLSVLGSLCYTSGIFLGTNTTLVNVISQKCLQAVSSEFVQMSTWP